MTTYLLLLLLSTLQYPTLCLASRISKVAFRALRAAGLLAGLGLTALAAHRENQRRQQSREQAMDFSGGGAGRDGHLDPSAGREVVYCHACSHEWYNDEHGLQCPRCTSDICEIVSATTSTARHISHPLIRPADNSRQRPS